MKYDEIVTEKLIAHFIILRDNVLIVCYKLQNRVLLCLHRLKSIDADKMLTEMHDLSA